MSTAENMANAFEAEANTAPVVNVTGVDAPTVISGSDLPASVTPKFYTEDDLAKVRSQEKSKLYPEIEQLKNEVESLKKEKEEKAARKAAEEADKLAKKESKQREKLEEELEAKDLIKLTAQELKEQLERERQETQRAFALLERERSYAELQSFKQNLIEQERDNVMPQLLKYLQGDTPEELVSSLEDLKAQTASIFEDAMSAQQAQRQSMVGTRATLPPAGALEVNSENRQFTAEDISAMPMNEYAKYRSRLLSPAAQGKTSGILG